MSGDHSDFVEIADGDTTWRFEREFLTSNWTCLFANGCKGILPEEAKTQMRTALEAAGMAGKALLSP